MTSLTDKTAFITGAASGIGLAMAEVFGKAGVRVAMADLQQSALDAAATQLTNMGIDVYPVQVDVTDREGMARARDKTIAHFGAVHLLFNNAGVNVAKPIDALTYKDWDWVMGVNLGGVINGVMTFIDHLQTHGKQAHIINTASVGGLIGMPSLATYNASKFAVVGLSEALYADFASSGVGISVLCPGVVRSDLGNSERNRPEHLKEVTEEAPSMSTQAGTDPIELAENVKAAVEADEFFIVTHAEWKAPLQAKHQAIAAGFKHEADPEKSRMMSSIIRPF